MELVKIVNIGYYIDQACILKDVSLTISKNEIITLIGPNGAGKSTLIKLILGLLTPSSGVIEVSKELRIGYVPQVISINGLIPLTVARFLLLHPKAKANLLPEYAAQTGIAHKLNTFMHSLSGGELQRALLARALIGEPNLLVLDEPVKGVDLKGQTDLYKLINHVAKEMQCSILMVSHDLHVVMASTSKVICLNKHICCHGSVQQVSQNPAFINLFGKELSASLALYSHSHQHSHNLSGDIS